MKKLQLFLIGFLCLFFYESFAQDERCNMNVDMSWLQANAPQRYQRFIDLENFTANYINGQNQSSNRLINGDGLIIIPVVVHVIHKGEAIGLGWNVSMERIQSQIAVLNEDFRRLNPDAANTPSAFQPVASDFGIEFRLACLDPNGNLTDGVIRKQTIVDRFYTSGNVRFDRTVDDALVGIKSNPNGSPSWPTDRYLNMWVCDVDQQGYATWPADYSTYPEFDGVVINARSFGRGLGSIAPSDKGRTATHEVGHWLNLIHLWGNLPQNISDNHDCLYDDEVADTPKQKFPSQRTGSSGCPTFPDLSIRCNTSDVSGTMFMNYMDYVYDNCYNMFTKGQKDRARAVFASGTPFNREQQLKGFFKVRQSVTPIRCTNKIYSSPACLPTTWTVLSGPATLTPGPGVNQTTLQATGTGTVLIRATAGNYTTDDNISVTDVPPTAQGYYFYSSNNNSCPSCQYGLGQYNSHMLPAGQSGCFNVNLTTANEFSNIQWANTGYAVQYTLSNGGTTLSFCITAGSGAYSSRTTTFTMTAQTSCGPVSIPYSFSIVTQGWFGASIFPNPAKNKIQLTIDEESEEVKLLSKNEGIQIDLISFSTNQKVRQWIFNNSQKGFSLNINGLRKGLYLLVIRKGKYSETKQVIIEE